MNNRQNGNGNGNGALSLFSGVQPFNGSGTSAIGLLVKQIGSAIWSQWQLVRWTWYDTVRLTNTAASSLSLQFFNNGPGGTDPVSGLPRNLEWTNMPQAGQFGQQYFVIQQMRTLLAPVPKARQNATVAAETTFAYDQLLMAQSLRSAYQTGVMDLVIGQKNYNHIMQPWRTAPPGFGVSEVIVPWDSGTNATGNAYVAQSNDLCDVYNLTPPQLVEPAQNFSVTISFPDNYGYNFHNVYDAAAQNGTVEARVYLDGYLLRSLQ